MRFGRKIDRGSGQLREHYPRFSRWCIFAVLCFGLHLGKRNQSFVGHETWQMPCNLGTMLDG